MEEFETRDVSLEKPVVYIKEITFNDDTKLLMEHSSIIVFTGPNNCGKSQVLKDVENGLDYNYSNTGIVINNCEYDFINDHFLKKENGDYQLIKSGATFLRPQLIDTWHENTEA